MSNVKQCDRCKILVKEDFGIGLAVRTLTFVLKIRPVSFDFCSDCLKEFKKFLFVKGGNNNENNYLMVRL